MKVLTLVLLIVAVVAAAALGYMWYSTKQAKADMEASLNKQIAAANEEAQKSAAEVERITAELTAKDSAVKKLQDEMAQLKQNQMAAAEGLIAEKEAEITKLKSSVDELQEKVAALESDVQSAQQAATDKDSQLSDLQTKVEQKDQRIAALAKDVEDWQGKEKAASDLADNYKKLLLDNKISLEPEKQFTGNILVAHAEPEFVILSLGADDDLPAGTELKVVRGTDYIGKITVQKLLTEDGHLSYATITSLANENDSVREGDVVKN